MLGILTTRNPYSVITTTGSVLYRGAYLLDSSAGAITVKLPLSPATNDIVVLWDGKGVWGTNNVTLDRNGKSILDASGTATAEDLVLNQNNIQVTMLYDGTDWRLL